MLEDLLKRAVLCCSCCHGDYSASLLEERVRARALEDQLLGEAVENPEFFSRKGRDLKKYPKMWIELICN